MGPRVPRSLQSARAPDFFVALILVGFDGSDASRRALEHASRQAKMSGAELVLATVIPSQVKESTLASLTGLELPSTLSRTFAESARIRLEETAEALQKAGTKTRVELRTGPTASSLLALADELQATEIVIGHKAFGSPTATMGPNAVEILRGAKIPVTVVP